MGPSIGHVLIGIAITLLFGGGLLGGIGAAVTAIVGAFSPATMVVALFGGAWVATAFYFCREMEQIAPHFGISDFWNGRITRAEAGRALRQAGWPAAAANFIPVAYLGLLLWKI